MQTVTVRTVQESARRMFQVFAAAQRLGDDGPQHLEQNAMSFEAGALLGALIRDVGVERAEAGFVDSTTPIEMLAATTH